MTFKNLLNLRQLQKSSDFFLKEMTVGDKEDGEYEDIPDTSKILIALTIH